MLGLTVNGHSILVHCLRHHAIMTSMVHGAWSVRVNLYMSNCDHPQIAGELVALKCKIHEKAALAKALSWCYCS